MRSGRTPVTHGHGADHDPDRPSCPMGCPDPTTERMLDPPCSKLDKAHADWECGMQMQPL